MKVPECLVQVAKFGEAHKEEGTVWNRYGVHHSILIPRLSAMHKDLRPRLAKNGFIPCLSGIPCTKDKYSVQ